MLNGLDDVDWARLEGAYGTAERVPDMLRAIAAGGPDSDDAVDEFVNEVFHQRTVWTCTEHVVPFVVELVLEPSVEHRSHLVYLLASLSYEGVDAVGPHVPRLTALLDDPDDTVRECAAYLVAWHDEHAEDTVPALMRRWERETVPLVRASVLAAVGCLDLDAGRSLTDEVLRDPDPVLRAAAGLTLVWMREWWSEDDVPLPPETVDAVASAFADGDPLEGWAWSDNAQSEFLDGLEGVPGARDVTVTALVRSPSADTRRHTLFEIGDRIRASRAAPARLVPLLGPLLSDEDASVRRTAAATARGAGSSARLVADELAERAATLAADGAEPEGAATALATLIDLDDPRWRPTLLAAWRSPRRLLQPAEALGAAAHGAPAPDDGLVAAVAGRIGALTDAVAAGDGRIDDEIDALAGLVQTWATAGAPAAAEGRATADKPAAAAPALTAALRLEVATDRPTPGAICGALAELGPEALPAEPALRTAAARSFHGYDRIIAALAVWRLTGDVGPALEVGALMLSGPNGYDEALEAWLYPESVTRLLPLGADLAPLDAHLRRHIAEHPERHKSNAELARMLWRRHGDADEVVPVLRAGLSFTNHLGKPNPPAEAIRAAAELGERAAPLLDLLRGALAAETNWIRAAAATVLIRLGAGDPAELIAAIVPEPRPHHRWWGSSALGALDDVAELRLAVAVPRLEAWLATDERVQGDEMERVRLDERFQARAREVVADLT